MLNEFCLVRVGSSDLHQYLLLSLLLPDMGTAAELPVPRAVPELGAGCGGIRLWFRLHRGSISSGPRGRFPSSRGCSMFLRRTTYPRGGWSELEVTLWELTVRLFKFSFPHAQGEQQALLTGSTQADIHEIPPGAPANLLLPSGAAMSNTEEPAPSFDYIFVYLDSPDEFQHRASSTEQPNPNFVTADHADDVGSVIWPDGPRPMV